MLIVTLLAVIGHAAVKNPGRPIKTPVPQHEPANPPAPSERRAATARARTRGVIARLPQSSRNPIGPTEAGPGLTAVPDGAGRPWR